MMIQRNERGQFVKGSKPAKPFKVGIYQGYGFKKGHSPWNKDKIGVMPTPWNKGKTEEITKSCIICSKEFKTHFSSTKRGGGKYCSRKCFFFSNRGENNPSWKGDDAGNKALHCWIRSKLGRPTKCEHCGKDGLIKNSIHWANISHEYKRDLSDWIRLCVSCHSKFDRERLLTKFKEL